MDKLRAIRFFCRAVETNSFTAAARALGVPQSVVSKGIAALESELQFNLFNRSTRQLALTEAGASYYEACLQMMSEMDEAETRARHGSVAPSGNLRIGLHPALQWIVCNSIGEFLTAHAGVNAEISHTNSPAALLEQGLDVLLRIGGLQDSSFVARKLGSVNLRVYTSPGYLRAMGKLQHPRDLTRYCAIIPGRLDEESFASWSFSNGKEKEIVNVPARLVLREGVGLAVSVIQGFGVVRMYDIAARPFVENNQLEPILQQWSCGREPVLAVIPSRRKVPAKVRAFIDFVEPLLK